MKLVVRNIILISIAAVVLFTTSGFNVFKHSCFTNQTTEYSFIVPDFECHHDHENQAGSDPTYNTACCSQHHSDKHQSCVPDKCCETETFLVKLKIDFDNHSFFKKIQVSDIIMPILKKEADETVSTDEFAFLLINNNLPPPLFGKDLHIYLHQLNIPPAIV